MADRFEHPHEDDNAAASADHFRDAIDLCRLAWDTQKTKARLVKLRKLEKDIAAANTKLAAAEAKAVELLAKAQSDVAAIHDDAQRRLEVAESAEEQIALREQKITRLESAWRNLGEPGDVLSGLRSPEFTPLQKARMAAGREPGRDPDRLFFAEPDAAPVMRIDALSDTSDDPHADRHGAPFLGELTRDVSHKRKSAA